MKSQTLCGNLLGIKLECPPTFEGVLTDIRSKLEACPPGGYHFKAAYDMSRTRNEGSWGAFLYRRVSCRLTSPQSTRFFCQLV